MPMSTRATSSNSNDTRNQYELRELHSVDRDIPDARLVITAGHQFTDASSVPVQSCINIAMQTDEEDESNRWSITSCMKKALVQRLAMAVCGIFVVIAIILLERFLGADIVDEKKLIRDIASELLPQLKNATAPQ
jgi:hypothetical protein